VREYRPTVKVDGTVSSPVTGAYTPKRSAGYYAIALMKRESTPGMRIKPIEPDKYYREARINDGDGTISREDTGTVLLVGVVPHEDIGKYGRKPPGA
jgi:hypothetical protein